MTLRSIPTRAQASEALKEAVKIALLAAGNAESLCIPLGDGRYIAAGSVESIKRLLPKDPFVDDIAANDEVQPPAGN